MPALRQEIVVTYDSRGVARARDSLGRFVKQTEREVDGLERKFGKFGNIVKGALAGIATFIIGNLIGALKRVGTELFEIGSAVGETESKFRTVFGDATENVSAFIDEFSQLSGLTRRQGQDFTSNIGAILQGMKATKEESADLSQQIVQLAGDLSSFSNVPIDEAFAAIRSGITGEAEPLKRFGIILREDEISLRALAETGKSSKASLTDLEKAQARINLIFEKAGVAVGDLERTQDSAANAARRLSGFLREQREEFAAKLIPAFEQLIEYGDTLLKQYEDQADVLGGRLAQGIKDIVFDLITFAEQVRNTIKAIQSLSKSLTDTLGGSAEQSLTIIEGLVIEIGKINTFIIDVQRGFIGLQAANASILASLNDFFGRTEAAAQNRQVRDGLKEQLKALDEQRVAITGLIDARRNLKAIGEEQARVQAQVDEILQGQTEKTKDEILKLADAFREQAARGDEFMEIYLQAAKVLGEFATQTKKTNEDTDAGGDKIIETARRAAEGLERLQAAALQAVPPDFLSLAQNDLEEFSRQVTTLENELSSGALSTEEFARALDALSADFIQRMVRLRDTLKEAGALTPALEKAFNNAFKAASKGAEDTDKNLRKASDSLDSLASAGRAVLRLASTFGDLSEGVERFASGVLDAIDNLAQLKRIQEQVAAGQQVGALTQAIPILGIAAGAAGALASLFQDDGRTEAELIALQVELRDNRRAILQNTQAILDAAQIGGGTSRRDIEAAQALVSEEAITQRTVDLLESGSTDFRQLVFGLISDLEDLNIEDLDIGDIKQTALDALENGTFTNDLINELLAQLAERVNGIADNLGQFSDTVDGSIEALRLFSQFVSQDAVEQFDFLLSRLLELEDLPASLQEVLTEIQGLDLTTQAGQDRLREIGATFAQSLLSGGFDLGALTPEEARAIFEEIFRSAANIQTTVADGADAEFARSVQIARSITEIQANEVIALLESQLFRDEERNQLLTQILAAVGGAVGTILPDPDPFNPTDPFAGVSTLVDTLSLSVPLTVQHLAPDLLTDDIIRRILIGMEDELRVIRRGGR